LVTVNKKEKSVILSGMENRAAPFKQTRKQHLLETAEDYTELIAELLSKQSNVRTCHLAKEMGVSHVTIVKTLKRLARDNYLKRDGVNIILTGKGIKLAALSKKKHQILTQFLLKIGVPKDVAACDVEGIEHHISEITLEAIAKLL